MKKKTFLSTCLIMVLVILSSCERFLEFPLTNQIEDSKAISTSKDLEATLIGAYDGLQEGNVGGGNAVAFGDFMANDAFVFEPNLSFFGTFEIYNRATTVQIGLLRDMWKRSYATINRANLVIDAIDNNKINDPALTDALKNQFKGEALFIRAYAHYNLVQFWSLPYNADAPGTNTQAGVIYRKVPISGFDGTKASRNTVEECYNNIIADLVTSDNLLSAVSLPTRFRANGNAAKALLARVYFQKGDHANASTKANEVITTVGYTLEDSLPLLYNRSGQSFSPEHIFFLINIPTDQSNSLVGFYSDFNNPTMRADSAFYNLFDSGDRRRKELYRPDLANGFAFVRKYSQTGANPWNVVLIRLAEMHLIRAEANLSPGGNGNTADALASYNLIRQRALKETYVEETSTAGLLEKVRLERRKELAFEGDRYNQIRKLKGTMRAGVPYNDRSLLFKIPQEEIAGNPNIEQN